MKILMVLFTYVQVREAIIATHIDIMKYLNYREGPVVAIKK